MPAIFSHYCHGTSWFWCITPLTTLSSQIKFQSYNMADYSLVFKLLLLSLIAAVLCQSYPRFEFRDYSVLVNNSYILRTRIGEGVNNSLHCATDYSDCCNDGQGNWYDETERVVHQGEDGDSDLYVTRGQRAVYLNRRTGGSSGMWRCDIPDGSGTDQSIYIYLGTPTAGTCILHHCSYVAGANSLYSLLIPVVVPEIIIPIVVCIMI